jgi:glycosyltransferase involved in cell wall biosynthesis
LISLIATVLNEGQSIHRLMRSITTQTRQPDEVVIVDGGSQDDTVALMETYGDRLPLRVIIEPGCNIGRGRNRAITAASGEIIAVTDAGVELASDWLEKITSPLLDDWAMSVVGGFFNAQASTLFELAMGATVLPLVDEINPTTFLPTSRSVAFRRSIWERVKGYPEWLDYCEDLVFDLRMKALLELKEESRRLPVTSSHPPQDSVFSTQHFGFVPDALVDFRPRGSFRSFFKQYYLYARGDGKADLWRKRHAARYLTYLVAIPLVFILGLILHPVLWLLFLPGAFIYLRQPYRRLRILLSRQPRVKRRESSATRYSVLSALYLVALIPLIRVVGDVAKMIGYPVGWWWRLRHHPPDWRQVDDGLPILFSE